MELVDRNDHRDNQADGVIADIAKLQEDDASSRSTGEVRRRGPEELTLPDLPEPNVVHPGDSQRNHSGIQCKIDSCADGQADKQHQYVACVNAARLQGSRLSL